MPVTAKTLRALVSSIRNRWRDSPEELAFDTGTPLWVPQPPQKPATPNSGVSENVQRSPASEAASSSSTSGYLVKYLGWLGPLALQTALGFQGRIAQALYFLTAAWAVWVVLQIGRGHWRWPWAWPVRLVLSLGMGLSLPLALERLPFLVPTPAHRIGLQQYNYAEGLRLGDMTWRSTYRIYDIRIINPRASQDMIDGQVYVEMPAVVRRRRVESVLAEGVVLKDFSQGELQGATVVEVLPSGEQRTIVPEFAPPAGSPKDENTITGVFVTDSNQVVLDFARLEAGGSIRLELLVEYDNPPCGIRGIVRSDYSYRSFFGALRSQIDRFMVKTKPDPQGTVIPPRELELVPIPRECPPCGGAICMAPGRESLIDGASGTEAK